MNQSGKGSIHVDLGDESSQHIAEMMSFSGASSYDSKVALEEKMKKQEEDKLKASKQKKREVITFGLLGAAMITFPFNHWIGITIGFISGVAFMWTSLKSTEL